MSTKHLLTCECGQTVPVEPSQAGDYVTCGCGARLEVPTLGQLRQLPRAEVAAAATKSDWGFRQGVLAMGLIVAVGLAALSGYWGATQPAPPPEFDQQAAADGVESNLDQLSPPQGYRLWVLEYQPLRGFSEAQDPREQFVLDIIARYQAFRWGALGLAAVVALASVGTFLGMKPRG